MFAQLTTTSLRRMATVAVTAATLTVLAAGWGTRAAAAPGVVAVGDTSNRFTPNSIPVLIGERVTFNWSSGEHRIAFVNVASIDLPIDSATRTGTTIAFVQRGSYFYYCTIHATADLATAAHVQANDAMVGRVVVNPRVAAPPLTVATPTRVPVSTVAPVVLTPPAATPVQTPAAPTSQPPAPVVVASPTPVVIAPLPPATGSGWGAQRGPAGFAMFLGLGGLAIVGATLWATHRRAGR
ncbi:MAG: hypothetical protein ACKVT1_08745 [Dehalococcoidia bacterium]